MFMLLSDKKSLKWGINTSHWLQYTAFCLRIAPIAYVKTWESQNVSAWKEIEGLNSTQVVQYPIHFLEAEIALHLYAFCRRIAYNEESRFLCVIVWTTQRIL